MPERDAGTLPARRRWSAEHWARAGISVQFLALVRTLAEVHRLRYVHGGQGFVHYPAYVTGGIIAAVLCWIAVLFYFFRRFRASVAVAVLTVVVLLAYKLAFVPT